METALSFDHPEPRVLPTIISSQFVDMLRSSGAIAAALFGSFATGHEGPESDIDVLVKFDRPVTLFEQLELADRLSTISGRPVDLITKLNPVFTPYVELSLIPLPI